MPEPFAPWIRLKPASGRQSVGASARQAGELEPAKGRGLGAQMRIGMMTQR